MSAGEQAGDAIVEAVFVPVREIAVAAARVLIHGLDALAALDDVAVAGIEVLERAIAEAERAQSVGPILDPTMARGAGPELERELRFLRATLAYRRELEEFRP